MENKEKNQLRNYVNKIVREVLELQPTELIEALKKGNTMSGFETVKVTKKHSETKPDNSKASKKKSPVIVNKKVTELSPVVAPKKKKKDEKIEGENKAILNLTDSSVKNPGEFVTEYEEFISKPIKIHASAISDTFEIENKDGKIQGKKGDYLVIGAKNEKQILSADEFKKIFIKYDDAKKEKDEKQGKTSPTFQTDLLGVHLEVNGDSHAPINSTYFISIARKSLEGKGPVIKNIKVDMGVPYTQLYESLDTDAEVELRKNIREIIKKRIKK
jgi:hypothetical protein